MPVLTVVVTHATGDVYPAADWNTYQRDNINYLIQAGSALVAAATINPTNEFHQVTGATAIQTITATTPILGQRLRLWFQSAVTLSNSLGNIRFVNGLDRTAHPNEIIEFFYDGANWRECRPLPRQIVALAVKSSPVTNGGGTFAVGTDVFASALSFTADGSTGYLFQARAGGFNHTQASSIALELNLDGAAAGYMAFTSIPSAGGYGAVAAFAYISPAAGAHTVNARLYSGAGTTATLEGGTGGASSWTPILGTVEVVG